jgi:glycosyltransferase involved in cell wall biosynthesis
MSSAVQYSVIVPMKDEQDNARALADEITAVMNGLGAAWECIWVNDGSTDQTGAVLRALVAGDAHHRLLELDRNYGQSAAMVTGFGYARGAVFITLDGDGQNDPHDIPTLLQRLARGDVDMVNGVRVTRRDTIVRRLSSRIANAVRNFFLHDGVSDTGCALRVFQRACVANLVLFKGTHRFIPALAAMRGFRITELPVNHRPRTQGVTKYGVGNRLWVGIADLYAVRWMRARLVYPAVRGEHTRPPA